MVCDCYAGRRVEEIRILDGIAILENVVNNSLFYSAMICYFFGEHAANCSDPVFNDDRTVDFWLFPKRIISAFQRQRAILKLPAVAAVILGAALGANGVAVFIDHQPGQLAQGNGVRFGGWCGKSDRKRTHTIIVMTCIWCPIF